MTYLTDEYWKKERQKERSKKRQQEMKTKVMKVYKENPDLSIKDIAELLGTTQKVVKNCLGAKISRALEEKEKNSETENESQDVNSRKGIKLTEKSVDEIVAQRDEKVLKLYNDGVPADIIAEKLRMELGQVLEVFYRNKITRPYTIEEKILGLHDENVPANVIADKLGIEISKVLEVFYRNRINLYTQAELEEIEEERKEETVTTAEDILRIMRKYNSNNQPEKVVSFAKKMISEANFLTSEQRQNLQQIVDTINRTKKEKTKPSKEEKGESR